jgi:hypothetical protein
MRSFNPGSHISTFIRAARSAWSSPSGQPPRPEPPAPLAPRAPACRRRSRRSPPRRRRLALAGGRLRGPGLRLSRDAARACREPGAQLPHAPTVPVRVRLRRHARLHPSHRLRRRRPGHPRGPGAGRRPGPGDVEPGRGPGRPARPGAG